MIFGRKKKDKVQKTRFEDQEDQKDGWSQHAPNSDPWGAVDQSGWGQSDQSGWEQPNQSGWEQPKKNGGWEQPKKSGWEQPNQSGWEQPKKNGGREQPKKSGWEQPKKNGGWEQPNQSGWEQPNQSGWEQPNQSGWEQPNQSGWEQPNQSGWEQPNQSDWEQPNQSDWGQTDTRGWDNETDGGRGSAGSGGWNTEVPKKQKPHSTGGSTGKSSHWSSWGHNPAAPLNVNSGNVKPLQRPTVSIPGKSRTTAFSPQDQSAFLNSLLSQPTVNAQRDPFSHIPFSQQQVHNLPQGVLNLKPQQPANYRKMESATARNQYQLRSGWDDPIPEEDEDELEYADEDDVDWEDNNHREYFAPATSYFSPPSRTLTNALGPLGLGKAFPSPSVGHNPHNHRFMESHGAALSKAHQALYGHERLAKERFYWSFSPHKDERVRSLMHWIEAMSEALGAFGLQKFIETGSRGALFANADFRPYESPQEPAFDWVAIEQLKDTLDKILQESVALYDPAAQVIVFVFLLSKSGNSMAIWRRKIPVVESLRTTYQVAIQDALANLKPDYPVYVDELPSKKGTSSKLRRVLSKRKWWKGFSKPPV